MNITLIYIVNLSQRR